METTDNKVQSVISPNPTQPPTPIAKPDLIAVNNEGKGKFLMYAVLILLILAMLGVGAYFLFSTSQIAKAPVTTPQPTPSAQVSEASPVPTLNPSEQAAQDQAELNSIKTDTSVQDFSTVDQDLSNL